LSRGAKLKKELIETYGFEASIMTTRLVVDEVKLGGFEVTSSLICIGMDKTEGRGRCFVIGDVSFREGLESMIVPVPTSSIVNIASNCGRSTINVLMGVGGQYL